MYLGETERKKVNSATIGTYEKLLYDVEDEEEKLISSFDRDIEKILGKTLLNFLVKNNYIKVKVVDGKVVGDRVLETFHYSDIPSDLTFIDKDGKEISIGEYYKRRVSKFFSEKTKAYKEELGKEIDKKTFDRSAPKILALASIGLTTFHRRKNMKLRDVQKIAGIGMCYGEIAELGTGEGKTVAAVLPAFMHALRGKGVHVVTANSYLSRRDYEELKPVYEGLGLTVGYVRSQSEESDGLELKESKRRAYRADITYSAKDEIAFDYLRDSTAQTIEDVVTRDGKPGFAIIDEVDDALVDSASSPYVIAGTPPYYKENMTLGELATVLSLPLPKVVEQLKIRNIEVDYNRGYSYEEAVSIAELFSKELYMDHHEQLTISQMFYGAIKAIPVKVSERDKAIFEKYKELFTMENGILRVNDKRLYSLLASSVTSDDSAYYYGKYKFTPDEIDAIRRYNKIIVCPTSGEFYVTDKTLEDHLNLQFLSSKKIMGYVSEYDVIIRSLLVKEQDYTVDKQNRLHLTMEGFIKLCEQYGDKVPKLASSYSDLVNNRTIMGSFYMHILYQCIIANELQVKGEDYVVRDGKVILLRNAREREGSNYNNGLHQAIEIKEAFNGAIFSNENPSLASITQKDFYSRYEMFSGMTGTSAHKIFTERYGKGTLEVPRASFYDYYSAKLRKQRRNTTREPRGVEKKNAVFALNRRDKFELIYNSILESHRHNPKAPVLIVVSDPKEIDELERFLLEKGITPNVIETTRLGKDKRRNEAIKVAKAGRSGMVTIATEMAGRGTDIKIGGDRDMLIDLAVDQMMTKKKLSEINRSNARIVCEESLIRQGIIPTREKEESDREKLAEIGLKVISSGFFESTRIDRQLEGRTGRNGYSGVTERYSSIEDLTHLGIERINGEPLVQLFNRQGRNIDGSISLSPKEYERLMHTIELHQSNNDDEVNESLKFSQELTQYTTTVMEELRSKRRHLLELTSDDEKLSGNKEYITSEINRLLRDTVDNILLSYITKKDYSLFDDGTAKERLGIDYEGLRLACKEVFGIEIDMEEFRNSDVSIYEFREALLKHAMSIHEKGLQDNETMQLRQDVNALIICSNNSLSRIHEREDFVRRQKSFDRITLGESADLIAIKSISDMLSSLEFESSKSGVRLLMGRILEPNEKNSLEERRKALFDYRVEGEEAYEPLSKEDDYSSIIELRKRASKVIQANERELENADRKALKKIRRDSEAEIGYLYSNLHIRPMAFVIGSQGTLVLKRTLPTKEDLLEGKKTI